MVGAETKGNAKADVIANAMSKAAQKNAQKNAPPVFQQTAQEKGERAAEQGSANTESESVIKDRTQRYKLHEVLTANQSGAPLFQSEATNNGADGPLRNDTPLGESEDSPTANNIPSSAENSNNNSDGFGAQAQGEELPIWDMDEKTGHNEKGTDSPGAGANSTNGNSNAYSPFYHSIQKITTTILTALARRIVGR